MKQQIQVTLLIDTINVNYDCNYEHGSKTVGNLQEFHDKTKSLNVEIYFFVENNQTNQSLIFEEAKYDRNSTFLVDIEGLKNIHSREIFLVSQNPVQFQKDHSLFADSSFVLYNQTEANIAQKEQIESEFYDYVQEHAGKCLHIASLVQLLPYIQDNHRNGLSPMKTIVGYHLYPKKLLDLLGQGILLDTTDIQFVPIDLRYFNQAQLKYINVVIHKNIDFNKGRKQILDVNELRKIDKNFELSSQYLIQYKREVKLIDCMDQIEIIQSRVLFQEVFDDLINKMEHNEFQLCTPQMQNFQNAKEEIPKNITFPIIVKTAAACSAQFSHTMALVISQKGIEAALEQNCFKSPLIFQQLVKHDGIIFKIYVIGEGVEIQVRGSLPNIEDNNFIPQDGMFIFDSQQNLIKQFESCLKVVHQPNLDVDKQLLNRVKLFAQELSQILSKKLNMSLFGYDLILEHNTNKLYIIDINYFPGYKNVDNVVNLFNNLFRK